MKRIAILIILISSNAMATCRCVCVDGEQEAVCTSAMELPPICAPQVCPIVPAAVAPIGVPIIPPLGTSECTPQQILNSYTGHYDWETICR